MRVFIPAAIEATVRRAREHAGAERFRRRLSPGPVHSERLWGRGLLLAHGGADPGPEAGRCLSQLVVPFDQRLFMRQPAAVQRTAAAPADPPHQSPC